MSDCSVKFAKVYEKEMNANYKKLMTILPKEVADKLNKTQQE
jgi:uncharacterized protein YecT (DUF1311 family)